MQVPALQPRAIHPADPVDVRSEGSTAFVPLSESVSGNRREMPFQSLSGLDQRCRKPHFQTGEKIVMKLELLLPLGFIDRSNSFELFPGKCKTIPVQILVVRGESADMLMAAGPPVEAIEHPFENPHVLSKARPDEFSRIVSAKPVDTENSGK